MYRYLKSLFGKIVDISQFSKVYQANSLLEISSPRENISRSSTKYSTFNELTFTGTEHILREYNFFYGN